MAHRQRHQVFACMGGRQDGRQVVDSQAQSSGCAERLYARQTDIVGLSFETTLTTRITQKLFRTSTGYQPPSLNGTFRRLIRDTVVLVDGEGKTRALYSLLLNHATMELLNNKTSMQTWQANGQFSGHVGAAIQQVDCCNGCG